MTDRTDVADEPIPGIPGEVAAEPVPPARGVRPTRVPSLGIWAWSFVGFVIAAIFVVIALGAVSEIVLR